MKRLKAIITVLLILLASIYIAFLAIIPNIIAADNYKPQIIKSFNQTTNLNLDYKTSRLVTTPDFKAILLLESSKVSYPNGSVLAYSQNTAIKIDLIHLLLREIKISDINLDNPKINLSINNNSFDISEFYYNEMANPTKNQKSKIRIAKFIPNLKLNNYTFIIKDITTGNAATIKGPMLSLKDIKPGKSIHVKGIGRIDTNKSNTINFNIDIKSFLVDFTNMGIGQDEKRPAINQLNALIKYNLSANINAKLKVKKEKNVTDFNGYIAASKITLINNKEQTLPSAINLTFNKHKTNLNADINFSKDETAKIIATVDQLKSKNGTEISVKTTKIKLNSAKGYIEALLDCFGIKNELSKIKVNGILSADFLIKLTGEELLSDGYLSLLNARITHLNIPAEINTINSEIDFSKNNILIKNTNAFVNNSKISAGGKIDHKTNTNIEVKTENLNLSTLLNAFAPTTLRETYNVKKGNLTFDAKLRGTFADLKPELDLSLKNLIIQDRNNSLIFHNESTLANIKRVNESYTGSINITKSEITNNNIEILNDELDFIFHDKNINIKPSVVYFNSSPLYLTGKINNYKKNRKANITLSGSIKAKDIASIFAKEQQEFISNTGSIPIITKIEKSKNKLTINSQILANPQNYVSPINITKLMDKSSIINLSAIISNNRLELKDFGLYQLQSHKSLGKSFKYNLSNAYTIAQISGNISDINKKSKYIENLNIQMPAAVSITSPAFNGSKLNLKGNIKISGYSSRPSVEGNVNISNILIPELYTKIQSITLAANNSIINAKVENAAINGSIFNIESNGRLAFQKPIIMDSIKISSSFINIDKIIFALEKINASKTKKKKDLPIIVQNGSAKIEKLKKGDILATNIDSDFSINDNIIKLNIKNAKTYNGKIAGEIKYNPTTVTINADIIGTELDANRAITSFLSIKDQIFGTLNFHSILTIKGTTFNDQMKTISGTTNFQVKDGQFGTIGSLDNYIKADNILSQPTVNKNIGETINQISQQNTSEFKYLEGNIEFKNSKVLINSIKSTGSDMSLYINGNYGLLNGFSNITVYGKVKKELANSLGEISGIINDNIDETTTKYGQLTLNLFNTFSSKEPEELIKRIPELTQSSKDVENFKVIINGNIQTPESVKTFVWIATPEEISNTQNAIKKAQEQVQQAPALRKPILEPAQPNQKEQILNQVQQQNSKFAQFESIIDTMQR